MSDDKNRGKNPETKVEYHEFPSSAIVRLVRGKGGPHFEKIQGIFDVKINQQPLEANKFRYAVSGIYSDVDLVISLLRDVSYEATIYCERHTKNKEDVGEKDWDKIKKHLDVAIPGYSSRRGEEKRLERIATKAASVTAERLRATFKPVSNAGVPPATNGSVIGNAPPSAQTANNNLLKNFTPLNISQAIFYLACIDPETSLIYGVGDGGGGKTYSALKAAKYLQEAKRIGPVMISRAKVATGDSNPPTYPGDAKKKEAPYYESIAPTVREVFGEGLGKLEKEEKVKCEGVGHVRGATVKNTFWLLDDAQSFTQTEIKTADTRLGAGTKIVKTGDISALQNDRGMELSGLIYSIASIGQQCLNDEALAGRFMFVKFSDEDSTARHDLMPHIIRGYSTLPEGFKAVSKPLKDYEKEALEAIEHNRAFTLDMLDRLNQMTYDRYAPQAQEFWPELFPEEAGKVVKLRVRGIENHPA